MRDTVGKKGLYPLVKINSCADFNADFDDDYARRGGLKAFKEGFVWYDAGGLESVYNDDPEIKEVNIDGHKLHVISNVILKPSTYTLGITGEDARILENPVIWLALMK